MDRREWLRAALLALAGLLAGFGLARASKAEETEGVEAYPAPLEAAEEIVVGSFNADGTANIRKVKVRMEDGIMKLEDAGHDLIRIGPR